MIDPVGLAGLVGSPADVGTLLVLLSLRRRIKDQASMVVASVVALARREDHVDDERLQDELDVDDYQVRAIVDDAEGGGSQ